MEGKYLKSALALAARDIRVFPIKPSHKFPPLITAWQLNATTLPSNIQQWWGQWPDANIGVACGRGSGVVVLDVDMKHGQNGEASLRALEAKHGPLPFSIETITPHGGRQIWFSAPDYEVRNSVSKLAPGLDIRGDGGYVVAPPSYVNDKDGAGIYSWSVDCAKHFAPAPEWVFQHDLVPVIEIDERRTGEYWKRVVCEGSSQGARNTTAASLTGWLLRLGLDGQTAAEIVLGWNMRKNRPPLPDDEIMTIVRSIASRELSRLGAT